MEEKEIQEDLLNLNNLLKSYDKTNSITKYNPHLYNEDKEDTESEEEKNRPKKKPKKITKNNSKKINSNEKNNGNTTINNNRNNKNKNNYNANEDNDGNSIQMNTDKLICKLNSKKQIGEPKKKKQKVSTNRNKGEQTIKIKSIGNKNNKKIINAENKIGDEDTSTKLNVNINEMCEILGVECLSYKSILKENITTESKQKYVAKQISSKGKQNQKKGYFFVGGIMILSGIVSIIKDSQNVVLVLNKNIKEQRIQDLLMFEQVESEFKKLLGENQNKGELSPIETTFKLKEMIQNIFIQKIEQSSGELTLQTVPMFQLNTLVKEIFLVKPKTGLAEHCIVFYGGLMIKGSFISYAFEPLAILDLKKEIKKPLLFLHACYNIIIQGISSKNILSENALIDNGNNLLNEENSYTHENHCFNIRPLCYNNDLWSLFNSFCPDIESPTVTKEYISTTLLKLTEILSSYIKHNITLKKIVNKYIYYQNMLEVTEFGVKNCINKENDTTANNNIAYTYNIPKTQTPIQINKNKILSPMNDKLQTPIKHNKTNMHNQITNLKIDFNNSTDNIRENALTNVANSENINSISNNNNNNINNIDTIKYPNTVKLENNNVDNVVKQNIPDIINDPLTLKYLKLMELKKITELLNIYFSNNGSHLRNTTHLKNKLGKYDNSASSFRKKMKDLKQAQSKEKKHVPLISTNIKNKPVLSKIETIFKNDDNMHKTSPIKTTMKRKPTNKITKKKSVKKQRVSDFIEEDNAPQDIEGVLSEDSSQNSNNVLTVNTDNREPPLIPIKPISIPQPKHCAQNNSIVCINDMPPNHNKNMELTKQTNNTLLPIKNIVKKKIVKVTRIIKVPIKKQNTAIVKKKDCINSAVVNGDSNTHMEMIDNTTKKLENGKENCIYSEEQINNIKNPIEQSNSTMVSSFGIEEN